MANWLPRTLTFAAGGPRRLTSLVLISKSAYRARPLNPMAPTWLPHRFLHRSALACNPKKVNPDASFSPTSHIGPILEHPLSLKSLVVEEPSMIQSLAERVQSNPAYKQQLLDIIELSKTEPQASRAASNAITILVKAKIRFHGADLRGIRVAGADLSGGQFDSAQLLGADLTDTNLSRAWIRQANLANTRVDGVRFGELPLLREPLSVIACAFSPDGKTFAVRLDVGVIKIYDTSTWTVIRRLRGRGREVNSLAYSPCGRYLVTSSVSAQLWDCQTGSLVRDFGTRRYGMEAVAYSLEGDRVCSAGFDKLVQVIDPHTGAIVFTAEDHTRTISGLAFSPDGRWVVSGGEDGTIRFYNSQTGVSGLVLTSPHGEVESIAFSPDGRQIVAGHRNGRMQVWDTASGELGLALDGHSDLIESVAFSPDGQWIASGGDDRVAALWDARTGSRVAVFAGHGDALNTVVFSPDGSLLVTGGYDYTFRRWEVSTAVGSNSPDTHQRFVPVTSVAYSHDGRWIISGREDGSVQQYDAATGKAGFLYPGRRMGAERVAFSPNSSLFASIGMDPIAWKEIKVWNAETGVSHAVLLGHTNELASVQFSSCGRWIASGSIDNTIRLWDVRTGALERVLKGHHSAVVGLEFSKDGRTLVSCSWDNTIRIWDLPIDGSSGDAVESRILHSDPSRETNTVEVAFAPSGQKVALCHWDKEVRIWDVATSKVLHTLKHDFAVCFLKFSSCGVWLATSGPEAVSLWKLSSSSPSPSSSSLSSLGECFEEKWTQAITIKGFSGIVRGVAWKPECLEFVTGCEDGSVRVWQIVDGPAGSEELGGRVASADDDDDVDGEEGLDSAQLVWSVGYPVLMADRTVLIEAVGLGDVNRLLLKQHGALDGTPPLEEEIEPEDDLEEE